jgi:1-acyl-sn-glycerol-3-phosphate acyltransferase
MKSLSRLLLKLLGWQLIVDIPPDLKKFVAAVAPHTSWKDLFLGLLVRSAMDRKMFYLGKKELFDSPIGFFFKWTGGKSVDRKLSSGIVQQVVQHFAENEEFSIALAPEGTRKKVSNLKSGFYFMAREANVPIIPCTFDAEHKKVHFMKPFYPTDDVDQDLDFLWDIFLDVKGFVPEGSITGKRQKGGRAESKKVKIGK